jgi:hypothetical protein
MKKYAILVVLLWLTIAGGAWAGPPTMVYPAVGVSTASNCNVAAYYAIGKLCQDTDDGKLYKGTGAAVEEVGAGTLATDTLWDAAGDTVYGTGANTGGRLAAGTAYQLLMMNSGATAPAWTSTLGVTGTRLTAGFFLDLTVSNAIAGSVTGNAGTATALAADPADCAAGQAATGIATSGALTCSATVGAASLLTGYTSGAGSVAATDSILQAIQKLNGNDGVKVTGPGAVTDGDVMCFNGTGGYTAKACTAINISTLNLPSSDADPGTTAGQIRHDSSDTASNSGGTAKWYDGAQVRSLVDTGTNYTIMTKTEFLPIRYAENGSSAPDAAAAVTGKVIIARNFAEGEDVAFFWVVPNDYIGGGPVKYRVLYALSTDGEADDTATFSMTGCLVANSGDLACAAGTALAISDEIGTDDDQYQYMVTDYSAESNADWGAAAGGLVKLGFSYAAAGDYTHDVLVIGIEIKYKAKVIGIGGY